MQTTAFSRTYKLACLVLLSPALVTVCRAQFGITDTPTLLLQPSGIQASGGAVTGWQNNGSAGSALDLGVGTGSPTLGAIGTQGAVSFDGSQYLLANGVTGTSLFSPTESTVFLVLNYSGLPANSVAFEWDTGQGTSPRERLAVQAEDNGNITFTHGSIGEGDQITATAPNSPNPWLSTSHVITLQRNGTDGTIRLDGQSLSTLAPPNFPTPAIVSGTGALTVGGSTDGGRFQGTIGEVVVYDKVLSTGDIQTVEASLTGTFGVVPEPSQYATVFGLICITGAMALRLRRQRAVA